MTRSKCRPPPGEIRPSRTARRPALPNRRGGLPTPDHFARAPIVPDDPESCFRSVPQRALGRRGSKTTSRHATLIAGVIRVCAGSRALAAGSWPLLRRSLSIPAFVARLRLGPCWFPRPTKAFLVFLEKGCHTVIAPEFYGHLRATRLRSTASTTRSDGRTGIKLFPTHSLRSWARARPGGGPKRCGR